MKLRYLHTGKAGQPIVTETWYATLSDHHPTSRDPSRVLSHLRNQAPVQPNSASQGPGGNLGRVQRTSVMSSSGSNAETVWMPHSVNTTVVFDIAVLAAHADIHAWSRRPQVKLCKHRQRYHGCPR
jgi:hypothetical protein